MYIYSCTFEHSMSSLLEEIWTNQNTIRLPTAGLSPHCFRVGGATQLHASGASADVIKQRGRWSSEAYQIYLKLTPAMMESLAADLLFDF